MAIGLLTGPLYDAGYLRSLLFSGTFLITLGFMATSICTGYAEVFLAQGICIGLGTSCLSIPSIAIVPAYFKAPPRRAIAMAVATLGSGVGSTVFPVIFHAVQERASFAWAVRVLGFISLALGSFAVAVLRPPPGLRNSPKPSGRDDNVEAATKRKSLREILRHARLGEKTYLVWIVAIFCNNVAFFEPPFYIQSYALSHGMQGQVLTSYLLVILNASSIPGRLLPPLLAIKIDTVKTMALIYLLSAFAVFYWISASTPGANIAVAVLYGFFSGGVVAFQPVVMICITSDLSSIGTRLGVLAVLKGIGSLVGPPIAGAILTTPSGYLGLQLFTGIVLLASVGLTLILVVLIRTKSSPMV